MTGRVKTPAEIQQAVTLRAGGYSLAAIADKTGISPSTLQRHFRKYRAPKGAISADAIEEARLALLNDAGFVDGLKRQIAASISDDLAHVAQLREAMATTLEDLLNDSNLPAHYRTRGIAALATSLRLTQEVARKALGADNLPIEQEDLPTLNIAELSSNEIEAIRRDQAVAGADYDDDDMGVIEGEAG